MPNTSVGVVGAGAMGSGIAQVFASKGYQVILGDADPAVVARSKGAIARSLVREVEQARLDHAAAGQISSRISDAGDLSRGYGAYRMCGLVIEAVVEDLEVKQALFQSLERVVPTECILATNTSSLSVAAIAGRCTHADRVVGMHFFNPAPRMPLVEVVPAITTSSYTLESTLLLVRVLQKTVVVATDTPGFIVNRIARPFYGESLRQLEEHIADAATIDWAMRTFGEFKRGPFELMDFIGNDVNYAVTTSVFESLFHDPRYRPSLTQRRLVEAGWYGRKRDRGFYDYRDDAPTPEPRRDETLGRTIVDRTLAMLVNEAADALYLRVASAEDIETAMTQGVNYPKGLLAWGDEIGPPVILARLQSLQAEYGEDRYRASPLLRRCVRDRRPLLP